MAKKSSLFLLVGLLFLLLAGCGRNEEANKGSSGQNELRNVTLRIGQTGWGVFEESLKAAGLSDTPYKVEYTVFQGGNLCLEAMAGDHIDLTETSEIPPIIYAEAANQGNFKIVAVYQSNTLNQEVVVSKNSSLQTIQDLKGKRIGYVKNTTAHYFLLKMLAKENLTWQDITPVDLSTSDGLMALLSGDIDALASYGNAIISAHQQGARTIASARDILSGNFPIEASSTALQDDQKRAAINDYLERLNKAQDWAATHQQDWSKIVAANTHQSYDQAYTTFVEGLEQRNNKILPISQAAIDSQQDIANQFSLVGVIKKADVANFWSHALDEQIKSWQ